MLGKLWKKLSTPPSSQVGKRNLERAWRAQIRGDMDKAREYNNAAAQAFLSMLDHDKTNGKRTFPARLAAAGITLLRTGNAQDAAPLLREAIQRQNVLFAAYPWAGLAFAHQGEQKTALEYWNNFSAIQAKQPVLGKIVQAQCIELQSDEISLAEAATAIEQGILQQDLADHREGKQFWLLDKL
ncbi:hypothetical protein SAMN02745704_01084 [Paucidesulfovibrio gracilis DSM 16080]|uniref:Tetratricopeptide repeat-containing protein n=1 Tax=Paucidesulfovibrio gracilis DSM 16080 TaxID=1121449 RepID=A0A1T4WL64_9BACT|nr:hypothetical protein [Paucidesulfovibrio gracilis]SKA78090.1 hypothetical protein SAMN02745704_01084 [Paucidesulfovibrio gracilis DSM 16080]